MEEAASQPPANKSADAGGEGGWQGDPGGEGKGKREETGEGECTEGGGAGGQREEGHGNSPSEEGQRRAGGGGAGGVGVDRNAQAVGGHGGGGGLRKRRFTQRRKAVENYAVYLGMDLERDRELLWLAEEGLFAPLPEGWRELRDVRGQPYYYDEETKSSSWVHPSDEHYRRQYQKLRRIRRAAKSGGYGEGERDSGVPRQRAGRGAVRGWPRRAAALLLAVLCVLGAWWGWKAAGRVSRRVRLEGGVLHVLHQVMGALGSTESKLVVAGAYMQPGGVGGVGGGGSQDLALEWYEMAAADGSAQGQRMSGIVLSRGGGVGEAAGDKQARMRRAGDYFSQAVAQGDLVSAAVLGYMHYRGEGRQVDYETAQILVQRAAEGGEANAMLTYGVMFLEGKALTRNPVQALKWLLLAQKHAGGSGAVASRIQEYLDHAREYTSEGEEAQAERLSAEFTPKTP